MTKKKQQRVLNEEKDKDVLLSALPTDKERILNKLKEEFIQDSFKTLTEAAKQVITIIPIIISIYLFGIGYINLKTTNNINKVLFITPVVSLILSMLAQ